MIRLKPTYRQQDIDLATHIVLELVRRSPGNEISGKSRLFHAFYFAHLFYAAKHARFLSEWPIVKLANGPGVDAFEMLVDELKRTGTLETEPVQIGPYWSTRFHALGELLEGESLSDDAMEAVRQAAELTAGKSEIQLLAMTHEYSRSWHEGEIGCELAIYLDLLTDEQYDRQKAAAHSIDQDVLGVWRR